MKQFYIKNDALGLGGVSWPQNRCCAQADEPLACAFEPGHSCHLSQLSLGLCLS